MNPRALQIHTDGSSKVHFGCKAGCAFVAVYPEHTGIFDVESGGISYDKSKIGAMEISGINEALKWIYDNASRLKNLDITSVTIHCDNQYVVDSANMNVFNWSKNGWKKKDGGDVANLDAWKKYMRLRRKNSGLSAEIKWIKGKTTEYTKKADNLAKEFADKAPRRKNTDYMNPKFADRLDPSILLKELHDGSDALIRIYYHQSVNKRKNSEHKVYFEVIEDGVVKNASIAYCSKEFDKENIDRKNYYHASFEKVGSFRVIFKKVKKIKGKKLEKIKNEIRKNYQKC